MLNKKLLPFERAQILRSFGFNINKDHGQIDNIRNPAYKDTRPSLNISLDRGVFRDFGDGGASGDIFDLLQMQTNESLSFILERVEKIIGRSLKDAKEFDIPQETKPPAEDFWTKEKVKLHKSDVGLFKNKGITWVNYLRYYDHIWREETLNTFGCGLYRYKDFEFGMGEKSYLNETFLSIPYSTGVMLYRRDHSKVVRHVKGSWAGESMFGYKEELFKSNDSGLLFVAKSPRESMSIVEFMDFNQKVLGFIQGEEVKSLTKRQAQAIRQSEKEGELLIKLLLDCDSKKAYKVALKTAKAIKESEGKSRYVVDICSIYSASDGKHKDFTDLCQASSHGLNNDKVVEKIESTSPIHKIQSEELDIFYKAVMEPIKRIK